MAKVAEQKPVGMFVYVTYLLDLRYACVYFDPLSMAAMLYFH